MNYERLDQLTEQRTNECFNKHVLEEVNTTRTFKLSVPGEGRMMSCYITFTDEGIVINGDITPTGNGVCSVTGGYGIEWFSSPKAAGYLAEKFLHKKWCPREVIEILEDEDDWVQETIRDLDPDRFYHLSEQVEYIIDGLNDNMSEYEFIASMQELGFDMDDPPGYTYDVNEVAWLHSIQKKFAMEWEKLNDCNE